MIKASESEWLRWFYQTADFGPADDEVRDGLKQQFMQETGKSLPDGYQSE